LWYHERKGRQGRFRSTEDFPYGSVPFNIPVHSYMDLANYQNLLFGGGILLAALVALTGLIYSVATQRMVDARTSTLMRVQRPTPPAFARHC